MKKKRSCRNAADRAAAEVVRWYSTWQARGEGTDPALYEQGYDMNKREPSRTPRPEKALNFQR